MSKTFFKIDLSFIVKTRKSFFFLGGGGGGAYSGKLAAWVKSVDKNLLRQKFYFMQKIH